MSFVHACHRDGGMDGGKPHGRTWDGSQQCEETREGGPRDKAERRMEQMIVPIRGPAVLICVKVPGHILLCNYWYQSS